MIRVNNSDTHTKVGHFFLRWEASHAEWWLSVWKPREGSFGVVARGTDIVDGAPALLSELRAWSFTAMEHYIQHEARLAENAKAIQEGRMVDRPGFRKGYNQNLLNLWRTRWTDYKRRFMSYYNTDPENIIYRAGWPIPKNTLPPLAWNK